MSTISDLIQHPALITHLTGLSNYSWIHFCDGKKELIAKPLLYFEKRLPQFLRIHKTALINPYYVEEYKAPPRNKMAGSVGLWGGITLPVGRRRWSELAGVLAQSPLLETGVTNAGVAKTPSLEPMRLNLFVVMADELKRLLLQQLIDQIGPHWNLNFFSSPGALKQALINADDSAMPALMILDGGKQTSSAFAMLELIKDHPQFRLTPTLITIPPNSPDLMDKGYATGANSVIPQPQGVFDFMAVFEKVLRYWLYMVSAPYRVAVMQ